MSFIVHCADFAHPETDAPGYLITPADIRVEDLERAECFRENLHYVVAFVRAAQRVGSWSIPFGPGHPNTPNRAAPLDRLTLCLDRRTIATHKFVCLLYLVAPNVPIVSRQQEGACVAIIDSTS